MADLQFVTFGELRIRRNGEDVAIGSPSQRRLLSMLLVNKGRVVSTDRLCDVLWDGDPPPTAVATLQKYISRLRLVLGSKVIVTRPPGYLLDVGADATDFAVFEALIARSATELEEMTGRNGDAVMASNDMVSAASGVVVASLLDSALQLWGGVPYAEFCDESWVRPIVVRLEALRIVALDRRVEALLLAGRTSDAVAEAEALCAEDPMREQARVLLMRCLTGADRTRDALRVFDTYRKRLVEESGLDPSPAMLASERAVLDALAAADRAVGRIGGSDLGHDVSRDTYRKAQSRDDGQARLVIPPNSFVGRGAEIGAVSVALSSSALVTLVGPGGVGKTRLAVEYAAAHAADFADGVRLVELADVREDSVVAIAEAVRRAVGAPSAVDPIEALQLWGRSPSVLVVLDNCEHVLDGVAACLKAIAPSQQTVRVLTTSRERLAIAGEQVVPLGPLGSDIDAAQLFVDRAQSARPGWLETVSSEPVSSAARLEDMAGPAVTAICSRLDGFPLAIELAAARCTHLTPAEILEQLQRPLRLLRGGARDAAPRHRALTAAIEWSWDLLSPDERHLFAGLSLFVGGCCLDGVSAIGTLDASIDVLDTLGALVEKSLVRAEPSPIGTRYRMFETLREFAADRLSERDDARQTMARFAEWGAELLRRTAQLLLSPRESEAAVQRNIETGNIPAAFETAMELARTSGDLDVVMRFVRWSAELEGLGLLQPMGRFALAAGDLPGVAHHRDFTCLAALRVSDAWARNLDETVVAVEEADVDATPLRPRVMALCMGALAMTSFPGQKHRLPPYAARLRALVQGDVTPDLRSISFLIDALEQPRGSRAAGELLERAAEDAERSGMPTAIANAMSAMARHLAVNDRKDEALALATRANQLAREARNVFVIDQTAIVVDRLSRLPFDIVATAKSVRIRQRQGPQWIIPGLAERAETLAKEGFAEHAATLIGGVDAGLSSRTKPTPLADRDALACPLAYRRGGLMSGEAIVDWLADELDRLADEHVRRHEK